jgi:glycosyltransferase involved in cell wall biosynthesis
MKVALCYDRLNKFGGAERVLMALHEIWPDAPVYTLTYSPDSTPWTKGWDIRSSFLQKIPVFGTKHELFPPLASTAWRQFDFSEFDLVISVTSAEAKALNVPKNVFHLCYCLTPTRYYWSGYFEYLEQAKKGRWGFAVSTIFKLFAHLLRVEDYNSGQKPNVMIGISDEVCQRIKKYYRRDSSKIYPPVSSSVENQGDKFCLPDCKPYFLVVSRLVPYKHVDLVVEAFNRLGFNLVIVGTGSELSSLKRIAKPNIHFVGFVDEADLAKYYKGCLAVIFSSHEDFGIVPVESQMYGRPVVAYRAGGALETVVEGQTGLFFDDQSAESLVSLLLSKGKDLDTVADFFRSFDEETCVENSKRFSKDLFKNEISKAINSLSSQI